MSNMFRQVSPWRKLLFDILFEVRHLLYQPPAGSNLRVWVWKYPSKTLSSGLRGAWCSEISTNVAVDAPFTPRDAAACPLQPPPSKLRRLPPVALPLPRLARTNLIFILSFGPGKSIFSIMVSHSDSAFNCLSFRPDPTSPFLRFEVVAACSLFRQLATRSRCAWYEASWVDAARYCANTDSDWPCATVIIDRNTQPSENTSAILLPRETIASGAA